MLQPFPKMNIPARDWLSFPYLYNTFTNSLKEDFLFSLHTGEYSKIKKLIMLYYP